MHEALPNAVIAQAAKLTHFVAENAKSARAFLKSLPSITPLQQINIQEKRAVEETAKENLQELQMIHQHFGVERQKRMEFKQQGEAKVEELNKLALGAELVDGTLERIAEIKVGDNMRELLNVEVLVEDDKIVAIRS